MSLGITVDRKTTAPGEMVTYRLMYVNSSPETAQDVLVSFIMPHQFAIPDNQPNEILGWPQGDVLPGTVVSIVASLEVRPDVLPEDHLIAVNAMVTSKNVPTESIPVDVDVIFAGPPDPLVPGPAITGVFLSAIPPSPEPLNVPITFTATPNGGKGPYTYLWWVFVNSNWLNSGWSSSNTFTWSPSKSGSYYQVAVGVRSAGNTGNEEASAVLNYVITDPGPVTVPPSLPPTRGELINAIAVLTSMLVANQKSLSNLETILHQKGI